MRERLAALEMISGFVDDAPPEMVLSTESVSMDSGGNGQRISGKLYKIRIVSGSDCTDGMIRALHLAALTV